MICPDCDVHIGPTGRCKKCGWTPPKQEKQTAGNGLSWWTSPAPYVKPKDEDLCGEPLEDGTGFCRKTVAQHRAEFLAFGARIARRIVRL